MGCVHKCMVRFSPKYNLQILLWGRNTFILYFLYKYPSMQNCVDNKTIVRHQAFMLKLHFKLGNKVQPLYLKIVCFSVFQSLISFHFSFLLHFKPTCLYIFIWRYTLLTSKWTVCSIHNRVERVSMFWKSCLPTMFVCDRRITRPVYVRDNNWYVSYVT